MAKVRGLSRRYRIPYETGIGTYLPTEIKKCIAALREVDEQTAVKGPTWWQLQNRKTGVITMVFNGVTLYITGRDTVEGVEARFHAEMKRRWEKYNNSPAGRRQAAKSAADLVRSQAEMDAAMVDLATLDFGNIEAVVNWMCRIQKPADHGSVKKPREFIIATFAEHGYLPKVNCGDDFDGEDVDNYGRYLVGQALDGIKVVGAPHSILIDFAADWREKFGLAVVPDPYATDDEDEDDDE